MHRLRRHAKIGLIHFMAFPEAARPGGPLLETLETILVDDYFDAVEVTKIEDPDMARRAAAMIESSHITVAFGAQPVLLSRKLNLNAPEDAARRQAIDAVRACLDQAALLHATGVAVLSGPCEPGDETDARNRLTDSLIELAGEAAARELDLVLEIFDDAVDKKALVGKAPVARAVGGRVRQECPNFGLMHDLSHLPLLGETPREALEPIADLLVHAHMGNCVCDPDQPGHGDQHPRFGVAGGANDVAALADYVRVLYRIGYLGGPERRILSFEVKPMPGESSRLVIANAKRVLNEAAARLEYE